MYYWIFVECVYNEYVYEWPSERKSILERDSCWCKDWWLQIKLSNAEIETMSNLKFKE